MELKFDKVLLAVVPYLYIISICYYWGYWGTLNVDAFNYFALTDIIKSIVTPIVSALGALLLNTLLLIGTEILDGKSKGWSNEKIIVSTLIYSTIAFSSLFYTTYKLMDRHPEAYGVGGFYLKLAIVVLYLFLALQLTVKICLWIIKPEWKEYFIWIYLPVFCLVVLPGRAFMTGKENALRIIQNKEFDYVSSYSLTARRPWFYKLLGKAGDYYLLTTMDDKRVVIAPISKMSPLITSHFSLLDSASVSIFRRQAKQMTVYK